jgi:hypothetical protein
VLLEVLEDAFLVGLLGEQVVEGELDRRSTALGGTRLRRPRGALLGAVIATWAVDVPGLVVAMPGVIVVAVIAAGPVDVDP